MRLLKSENIFLGLTLLAYVLGQDGSTSTSRSLPSKSSSLETKGSGGKTSGGTMTSTSLSSKSSSVSDAKKQTETNGNSGKNDGSSEEEEDDNNDGEDEGGEKQKGGKTNAQIRITVPAYVSTLKKGRVALGETLRLQWIIENGPPVYLPESLTISLTEKKSNQLTLTEILAKDYDPKKTDFLWSTKDYRPKDEENGITLIENGVYSLNVYDSKTNLTDRAFKGRVHPGTRSFVLYKPKEMGGKFEISSANKVQLSVLVVGLLSLLVVHI